MKLFLFIKIDKILFARQGGDASHHHELFALDFFDNKFVSTGKW